MNKNVPFGYKKNKTKRNFYEEQANFVAPSYILRMWQLCTAVGPTVSLKDIFQKVEGKKNNNCFVCSSVKLRKKVI